MGPFGSHFSGDHFLSDIDGLPDGKETDLNNPNLANPEPNRLLELKKSEVRISKWNFAVNRISGYQVARIRISGYRA